MIPCKYASLGVVQSLNSSHLKWILADHDPPERHGNMTVTLKADVMSPIEVGIAPSSSLMSSKDPMPK